MCLERFMDLICQLYDHIFQKPSPCVLVSLLLFFALKAFKRLYLDLRSWEGFKSHGNLWFLCEGLIFCTVVSNNSNIKHPPKKQKNPHQKNPQKNQQIEKYTQTYQTKIPGKKNHAGFPYHLSWIKLDEWMHTLFLCFVVLLGIVSELCL